MATKTKTKKKIIKKIVKPTVSKTKTEAPETPDKHAGGRPPYFDSEVELQKHIDEYFMVCDPHIGKKLEYEWLADGKKKKGQRIIVEKDAITEQVPYTMTGLAMHLGMDRRSLLNYSKKDQFFPTIKKAKLKVEQYQENLLTRGCNNTGVIFNLKNNFDWQDENSLKVKGEVGTYVDLVLLAEKEGKDEEDSN